jgi:hypothetical protein
MDLVEFQLEYLIPLDVILKNEGHIPAKFQSCFLCGETADALLCGNIEDSEMAERMGRIESFKDLKDRMVVAGIRDLLHTTIELPVCKFHRHKESALVN